MLARFFRSMQVKLFCTTAGCTGFICRRKSASVSLRLTEQLILASIAFLCFASASMALVICSSLCFLLKSWFNTATMAARSFPKLVASRSIKADAIVIKMHRIKRMQKPNSIAKNIKRKREDNTCYPLKW